MKEVYGIKKVSKGGEEKSFWTRLGIAYENKDGSLNVYLDYVPVVPGIVLNIREPKEKESKGENHENKGSFSGSEVF